MESSIWNPVTTPSLCLSFLAVNTFHLLRWLLSFFCPFFSTWTTCLPFVCLLLSPFALSLVIFDSLFHLHVQRIFLSTVALFTFFSLPVVNSGRTAKLVKDDGQINLDGKFKVIAPHDIQSDNINAGPQEVSLAKSSDICIAVSSFTVGVVLFSAVLILSVLVTFFVCFRLRRFTEKIAGCAGPPPLPRKEGAVGKHFAAARKASSSLFAPTDNNYRLPSSSSVVLTNSTNCQQCWDFSAWPSFFHDLQWEIVSFSFLLPRRCPKFCFMA